MKQRQHLLAVSLGLLISLVPAEAAAHVPTAGTGASRLYPTENMSLPWDFPATYPTWMQSAAKAALDTNYDDPATNNSRTPMFTFTAGGAGDVYYDGHSISPCGTGNPDWLQCANGGGTTVWNIYIRNFTAAPHGSWTWYDITSSCNTATQTCWYARRALIHEVQHVTMGMGNHDSQGESNTVMASVTPWYANTGWNQIHIRRCDEAQAQLLYDLRSLAGHYADCFDHITNHGPTGLQTNLTLSGTSFHECNGIGISVSGRLEVKSLSGYGTLGGNPLGARTVWFDRGGTGNYTSTLASTASGFNWSKVFTGSNASYSFVAHFNDASGDGLDDSNRPSFTASWSSVC